MLRTASVVLTVRLTLEFDGLMTDDRPGSECLVPA